MSALSKCPMGHLGRNNQAHTDGKEHKFPVRVPSPRQYPRPGGPALLQSALGLKKPLHLLLSVETRLDPCPRGQLS